MVSLSPSLSRCAIKRCNMRRPVVVSHHVYIYISVRISIDLGIYPPANETEVIRLMMRQLDVSYQFVVVVGGGGGALSQRRNVRPKLSAQTAKIRMINVIIYRMIYVNFWSSSSSQPPPRRGAGICTYSALISGVVCVTPRLTKQLTD